MGAGLVMIGELRRLEGWESRLAAVLEAARARPYQLGEHDCFRLACASIEALTGVDAWPQFRGRYSSRREALVLIAQYGSSFTAAFSKFFGAAPVPMARSRRGDVAEYRDAEGEAHLGVVAGARVAGLGERGLKFLARSSCLHAWRIG